MESGLQAPRASFGGVEIYVDLPTKAAVLALAFARFQRCPDGNKRLALILLFTFLAVNGYRLTGEQEELAQVILDGANAESDEIARGNVSAWIDAHISLVTD